MHALIASSPSNLKIALFFKYLWDLRVVQYILTTLLRSIVDQERQRSLLVKSTYMDIACILVATIILLPIILSCWFQCKLHYRCVSQRKREQWEEEDRLTLLSVSSPPPLQTRGERVQLRDLERIPLKKSLNHPRQGSTFPLHSQHTV